MAGGIKPAPAFVVAPPGRRLWGPTKTAALRFPGPSWGCGQSSAALPLLACRLTLPAATTEPLMDMSHHERDEEEEDGSEFTLHQRLADAITSMLCAALLPNADDTADHHADMLTALDLIAFNILQHNFRP